MNDDPQYIITPRVVITKEDGASNLVSVLKEMSIQDGYHRFVMLLFATAGGAKLLKYEQQENSKHVEVCLGSKLQVGKRDCCRDIGMAQPTSQATTFRIRALNAER